MDEWSTDEARLPWDADWEPVRLVGAGGNSNVYEVVDAAGDWSAVKVLSRRPGGFLEAKAEFDMTKAAGAVSPAVVRVFGVGVLSDERAYIRMELLVGRTLAEAWSVRRNPKSACRSVAAVARAVHPAHEAGLIHCDLKPENIFVESSGRIRLLDFGFSRDGAEEAEFSGTLHSTAPELLVSEQVQPTPQSDIYSLGAVLYEGLCGVRPFAGATYPAVLLAIHAGALVDVKVHAPRLREQYAQIVRRAMHHDPAKRFASMAEMADALDEASSEDREAPPPPSLRP
ncbi:MAG: serine/threonine-protein kinase [Polyangiales bacterium]